MARIRIDDNKKTPKSIKSHERIWKAGLYTRLSKEDGNDESESVVNQKKILDAFMENDFEGPFVIVDHYIDDGLTGTDDTRADFMRLIQDIEQGKVNCMVCKTLSRAFRNYSDQGYYLESYFPQKDARFISIDNPKVDTFINPDAITGLEVPITGLMNDRFASKTSQDIRHTFKMKRQKGEYIGAFPPYGFLKDPENKNRLILDPEIVPVKRDMKDWIIIEGMSLGGIAKKLNELGIPNPTAYKRSKGWNYNNPHAKKNDGLWQPKTVRDVLLSKANIGHMVQGKQRVISYKVHVRVSVPRDEWFEAQNAIEPTFTLEEFDQLVRILKRDTRTANGKRSVYLFGGFLQCADCCKAMHRRATNTKNRVYYACRTYVEKSVSACTRHSIRHDELEKAVLISLQRQIDLLKSLAEIVDKINETPIIDSKSSRIEKTLKDKKRELEKRQAISDELHMDWKTGDISREEYQRLKAKYQEQIALLKAVIENLEKEQAKLVKEFPSESEIFRAFLKYGNIQTLDRAILNETVEKILIHENKAITIQFRFAEELEQVLEFVTQNIARTDCFF